MKLPLDTKAILLLCGYFGGRNRDTAPLSPGEYNKLAAWLLRENLRPEDLLGPEGERRLDSFSNGEVTPDRIRRLLQRGMELGFAVEEWSRQGMWVVSRGEEAYPSKLKKRLRESAPPLLFGAGDLGLLETLAVGVVGSRDADDGALEFTRQIGGRCSSENLTVVSGGARGIDQASMISALESGGKVVAVLAEGIAKPAVSKQYREFIQERRLVLISPYHPNARWTTGNAMGRNKHIYAFSDWTIVVSSGTDGGTWSGAVEDVRNKWVPLLVRMGEDVPEGNKKLAKMGGVPIHSDVLHPSRSFLAFLRSLQTAGLGDGAQDLFSDVEPNPGSADSTVRHVTQSSIEPVRDGAPYAEDANSDSIGSERYPKEGGAFTSNVAEPSPTLVESNLAKPGDLFPVVWPSLSVAFENDVASEDLINVANEFNVQVGQLRAWIKRAIDAKLLQKRTRPVRYKLK